MTDAEMKQLENSIIEEARIARPNCTIATEVFREYGKRGKANVIFDKRIVTVPDDDLNITVCDQLEREFSRTDLLSCNGFILEDSIFLWLDLYCRLSERGFLMPFFNSASGLITALRVFRRLNDEFPFVLRSRRKQGSKMVFLRKTKKL